MGRAAAAVPDPEKEDTDASWVGLPFTEGGAAEEWEEWCNWDGDAWGCGLSD